MNSDDPILPIMATLICKLGDMDDNKHFKKLIQQAINSYMHGTEAFGLDLNIIGKIFKLPQETSNFFNLYNLYREEG